MKAVVVKEFGPPETLTITDRPDPVPAADEVVIDVAAAGVNFPDLLVVAGTYQILPERPFSPGKEIAGVVSAVGDGVSDLTVGQRVMAQIEYGGYAERVAVPRELVIPLPDGVDFDSAAAFGLVYVTAHFALKHRAHLAAGETVLVTGAGGGVGSATVQLAKAWGATVIAVASGRERAELAMKQGADHVVDADPATLRDEVRALTDGRGADVVVELIGGDIFSQALRCVAWEGRLVVAGFASAEIPKINAGHILVKNIAVTGLQVSDYRDRDPAFFGAVLDELLHMQAAGTIDVPVVGTYPLSEAGEVLKRLAARELKGKVVLAP